MRVRLRWRVALAICVMAAGCRSPEASGPPSIQLDTVPEAAAGGPDTLAPITGRVTGARPGQQVVLFAKSGIWWVQPLAAKPFTKIEAGGTWKSTTHFGSEYAALLVEPGYRPPATTELLPRLGDGVIAATTAKGTGRYVEPAPKRLTFSGYEWDARNTPSERGGWNDYDPANVWTDEKGFLHLKLSQHGSRWVSAEVVLTRALGYGTYVFVVRETSHLDPTVTLGLFTWDDGGSEQNHRELDIEIGRWGDLGAPNAQFVVQPYYVPANVARFTAPAGVLTHSFRWQPGRATFTTTRGRRHAAGAPAVARHDFTSGVPVPGAERVRMNLYFFRYSSAPPPKDVEVVIERFQYFP